MRELVKGFIEAFADQGHGPVKVFFDEHDKGLLVATRVSVDEVLFSHLYVLPEARSQGVAQGLTQRAEEWARANGATFLSCIINTGAGPERAAYNLKGFMQYGFEVHSALNKCIIMKKDI